MSREKQVDALHYRFSDYMDQRRWSSLWYQIDEVLKAQPRSVLEVGKGAGLLGPLLKRYGIDYQSADIDRELEPDYVASVTELPFENGAFDVVACFQVLEHLPYEAFPAAIKELIRTARKAIIISLPDARVLWRYVFHVPKRGPRSILIPKPQFGKRRHHFDGQHYWEINKQHFPLSRILSDMLNEHVSLDYTFRVDSNPYHRFFFLRKLSA